MLGTSSSTHKGCSGLDKMASTDLCEEGQWLHLYTVLLEHIHWVCLCSPITTCRGRAGRVVLLH